MVIKTISDGQATATATATARGTRTSSRSGVSLKKHSNSSKISSSSRRRRRRRSSSQLAQTKKRKKNGWLLLVSYTGAVFILLLLVVVPAFLNLTTFHRNLSQSSSSSSSPSYYYYYYNRLLPYLSSSSSSSSSSSTTSVTPSSTRTSFADRLVESLESMEQEENDEQQHQKIKYRYYVYDDFNMSRPDIRSVVKQDGPYQKKSTWKFKWGRRLINYAISEIVYLEALEGGGGGGEQQQQQQEEGRGGGTTTTSTTTFKNKFRTYNISEANFFIIPIPIAALITYGTPQDTRSALDCLYGQPTFQAHPDKHVMLSLNEFTFHRRKINSFEWTGWTEDDYFSKLKDITLVHEVDDPVFYQMQRSEHELLQSRSSTVVVPNTSNVTLPVTTVGWGRDAPPNHLYELTKHTWSLSLSAKAAEYSLGLPYQPSTVENFYNNKPMVFFYHTTPLTSLNNSTQFRHGLPDAVIAASNTTTTNTTRPVKMLKQPSEIGYGLSKEQWIHDTSHAKFCPAIRGDNPMTTSIWRSVLVGCIPVIVSDVWEYYSPIFRSQIHFDDFCVVVDEMTYLVDPIGSMNDAIDNLSENDLKSKIETLAVVQRMLIPDDQLQAVVVQPDEDQNRTSSSSSSSTSSLFVHAFIKETLASWEPSYTNVSLPDISALKRRRRRQRRRRLLMGRQVR